MILSANRASQTTRRSWSGNSRPKSSLTHRLKKRKDVSCTLAFWQILGRQYIYHRISYNTKCFASKFCKFGRYMRITYLCFWKYYCIYIKGSNTVLTVVVYWLLLHRSTLKEISHQFHVLYFWAIDVIFFEDGSKTMSCKNGLEQGSCMKPVVSKSPENLWQVRANWRQMINNSENGSVHICSEELCSLFESSVCRSMKNMLHILFWLNII